MKQARLLPSAILLTLLASGCVGTPAERAQDSTPAPIEDQAEEKDKDEAPDPEKLEKLEHELGVSRAKLEIAELKVQGQSVQREQQLAHAREEVAMAAAKLEDFVTIKLVGRRGRAQLDLRSVRDSTIEAAEELQQLEFMYEDQDLADETREFVVSRGRRRAERAALRLELEEADLTSLLEYELPTEQRKLELALRSAEEKLAKTEHEGALEAARAELEIREAQVAVVRAEKALEKALEKAREGGEE